VLNVEAGLKLHPRYEMHFQLRNIVESGMKTNDPANEATCFFILINIKYNSSSSFCGIYQNLFVFNCFALEKRI